MKPSDLLTTTQAGEVLGVNASRVRQLVLAGDLEGQRFGRDVMIERRHVERLKRAREAEKEPGK